MKNIAEIQEKSIWDSFFNENGSPSFLHSWEWGELQQKLGHEILRIGLYNDKKLSLIAQIIKLKTKRGNFLFIPHGPIVGQGRELRDYLPHLKEYLINLAKKEKFSFIRIAPVLEDGEYNRKTFSDVGFKKAPIYIHSERMWVLPLDKPADALLADMRKTTRYLIKKAQKDGVIIENRTDEKAFDDFWEIYQHTAERERFTPFSKQFITGEYQAFHKTGNAVFLFGKVADDKSRHSGTANEYQASALIVFTQSAAFYHQGASIHSKIPVPYLLQWEGIKLAKQRGCKYYNFQGILQPGRTPKNWSGLTLFKQGFGGHQIDYVPTQDLILSPKYHLTRLYEQILNWKRGV